MAEVVLTAKTAGLARSVPSVVAPRAIAHAEASALTHEVKVADLVVALVANAASARSAPSAVVLKILSRPSAAVASSRAKPVRANTAHAVAKVALNPVAHAALAVVLAAGAVHHAVAVAIAADSRSSLIAVRAEASKAASGLF